MFKRAAWLPGDDRGPTVSKLALRVADLASERRARVKSRIGRPQGATSLVCLCGGEDGPDALD